MGQTQLLLAVLGLLLLGIAISVGVQMFQANAVEQTRNAIMNDLGNFAGRARAYFWKPAHLGGGEKSFNGVTIRMLYPMTENPNARYYVETANDDECTIVGVGKIVSGEDSIRIRIRVTERRNIIEVIN
ncbi:MAG: hypothetical protein FJ217_12125 [Ignavibacteria bacterium]|nr:hypothetical protein [Ignavibacteria bacterium]